jgi:hypothetical protein
MQAETGSTSTIAAAVEALVDADRQSPARLSVATASDSSPTSPIRARCGRRYGSTKCVPSGSGVDRHIGSTDKMAELTAGAPC